MGHLDAVTVVPEPVNEPVHNFAPGSKERSSLEARIKEMAAESIDLTATIGGEQAPGSGEPIEVVQPHRHAAVLGTIHQSTAADVRRAVDAAVEAAPGWRDLSFDDRAAVLLRAADLLSGPWRDTLNASTMLGQSKTAIQAEIDAAAEMADFFRFNVSYARRILAEQPLSAPLQWNRMEYRPLEGFVLAITPFNFTSIAGNLPSAPALMGNTVVWKPSPTQQLSAHYLMRMFEAAGMPPGVINMITGHGAGVSEVALTDPHLAGIHFTGSTPTFQHLWQTVGQNISSYRGYPRLVGETGGKDFIVAHPSADVDALRTGMIRGAFEFQGQKCSAASRAYVPRSVWNRLRDELISQTESLPMGDPTDFANFMGAVIDDRAFRRLSGVLEKARTDSSLEVLAGGTADDSEGYFVRPTLLLGSDPGHEIFNTEYFGPILGIFVYDDAEWPAILHEVDQAAPYALTGAVFARDQAAVSEAMSTLRFTAGNFYVNDKPTGAVVGQQPFGGARASGTNDKAGSLWNLMRWVSPRSIKENLLPPTEWRYPHMG